MRLEKMPDVSEKFPAYFKGRKCLRKKVLRFGQTAKLLHFAGINFCGS